MNPWIRWGAVAIGIIMIAGSSLFAMTFKPPANDGAADDSPSWVRRYSVIALGSLLIVGGISVDARWAVLTFVVVLFGLTTYKLVTNMRAGGYGGEE